MATAIKLKKSSVPGKIPAASDLAYGELAINYRDGKLYYKNSSNVVTQFIDSANTDSLVRRILEAQDSANFSYLVASGLSYPAIDGIAGQAIVTDGAGNLTFGDTGIDSDAIISLIDSDYVQARAAAIADANTVIRNSFVGDSSTASFTLSKNPTTEHHALVTINGVAQHVSSYDVVGSTITFTEAPASSDQIEVRTLRMQTGVVTARDYTSYIYQPTSATSSISGADINAATLAYDVGKLDVYLNGARLVNGLDYSATDGTSITLLGDPVGSGDTITVSSFAAATINREKSSVALTTTGTNQTVDTFNKNTTRTAKYVLQMSHGTRYHSQEVLVVHNDSDVFMTTYADIYTESDLGTVNADITGDAVRIMLTPNYANTTVKTTRIEIEV